MLFNTKSTTAFAASALMALLASVESASAVPTANLHSSRGESMAKLHHRQTSSTSTVTPTAPGPGDKFKAGGECTTEWTAGSDPAWKSFDIDLMTGSNTQMTKLATVASGLDGSSSTTTSITYTCPEVSPYSAIYFYQYTPKGTSDGEPTWTTRFTITDANGKSVAEPQKTQPDGKAIPWGTGKLVDSVTPATGSSSSSNASSSSGSSNSTTSGTSTSASQQQQQQSSSASVAASPSTQSSASTASTASTSSSSSSSQQQNSSSNASTNKSNSTTSGALTLNVASASSLVGAVVAVFAAASLLV